MLELQHIHKMYNPGTINEICLFEDFNLKIEDGQFVSVVGSNGSGKTSMLNIISVRKIISVTAESVVYFRTRPREPVRP